LEAKRIKRRAERKWRSTGTTAAREEFDLAKTNANKTILEAKKTYYNDLIARNENNPKKLYNTVNELLNKDKPPEYPSCDNYNDLVEKFADFFEDKIINIRNQLQSQQAHSPKPDPKVLCNSRLADFAVTDESEVRKIIMKSPTKSCNLDPVPSWLVKCCINELLPVLTAVVNLSLTSGEVPHDFKSAIIIPLIKKANLDQEQMKNFRPVANLTYVSKLVERVVDARLSTYLHSNGLNVIFQSAYKSNHSTETALTRVHNDILISMDKGKCVMLVLLDLSAAFDTIDHAHLLQRLELNFGVVDRAYKWFDSYLSHRKQAIQIENNRSVFRETTFGVPQGSVLGPILFCLYTAPLATIISKHNIQYHLYADDTQLYLEFYPSEFNQTRTRMENCIGEVQQWMTSNLLKLNSEKTELLILASPHNLQKIQDKTLQIGGTKIEGKPHVKNLGAFLDEHMSMSHQVNQTVKTAYMTIKSLYKIRQFLTPAALKKITQSLVLSRIDYMSILLMGAPNKTIKKAQKAMNAAARLITNTRRQDHISPVLKDLQWMTVKNRIDYKIALMVFKSRIGKSPSYITDLIRAYSPPRPLRSGNQSLLQERRVKSSLGQKSFTYRAPKVWNDLPHTIRSIPSLPAFKYQLKKHYIDE
jgi:hypothetical protein